MVVPNGNDTKSILVLYFTISHKECDKILLIIGLLKIISIDNYNDNLKFAFAQTIKKDSWGHQMDSMENIKLFEVYTNLLILLLYAIICLYFMIIMFY